MSTVSEWHQANETKNKRNANDMPRARMKQRTKNEQDEYV